MQKYIIAVGSPEISREVQEALFRAGFIWQNGDRVVDCTSRPFLILNAYMQGGIAYDDNTQYQEAQIRNGSRKLISSQEVIADPFQLDGATKPTVDMTMEDLEKHFGHPVKITKKK